MGWRQQALLAALRAPGAEVVWAVPGGVVNRSERSAWRRAAKSLVLRGEARAVYLRRLDRSGRMTARLALVSLDSPVRGDVLPRGAPRWVERPALEDLFLSLNSVLQAEALSLKVGRPVSASTAGRIARKHHDARRESALKGPRD